MLDLSIYFDRSFRSVILRVIFRHTASVCLSQLRLLSITTPRSWCCSTVWIISLSIYISIWSSRHGCSVWSLTLIGPVVSEEKMFENVDYTNTHARSYTYILTYIQTDRRQRLTYPISSPLSLRLRWSKNLWGLADLSDYLILCSVEIADNSAGGGVGGGGGGWAVKGAGTRGTEEMGR